MQISIIKKHKYQIKPCRLKLSILLSFKHPLKWDDPPGLGTKRSRMDQDRQKKNQIVTWMMSMKMEVRGVQVPLGTNRNIMKNKFP